MKSLIGRQVYFKMSKKAINSLNKPYLTPNTLYTIIKTYNCSSKLVDIESNNEIIIVVRLNPKPCAHLNMLTGRSLKRKEI